MRMRHWPFKGLVRRMATEGALVLLLMCRLRHCEAFTISSSYYSLFDPDIYRQSSGTSLIDMYVPVQKQCI